MKQYDYLIVGAGLSGSTMARLLTDSGKKVLVIEKRDHVGGNIATHIEEGIAIHDYGPHIFHTSYEDVWAFFNKYCEALPFINTPLANYNGKIYHMPFNMNTFHELWGVTTPEEAKKIIAREVELENIQEPENLEEQALSLVGRTIYETLVKGYTEKQWGRDCDQLPASIIKRLPLRFEYNNNYFNDIYQAIPRGGFSALIDNLLEGVEVRCGVDYFDDREGYNDLAENVIYTGLLDEYFNYSKGHLQYRSLRFETERYDMDDFQHNAVVNYTTREPAWTRITEHKHFDSSCENRYCTFVTREYPDSYSDGKIPYYTINDETNNKLAEEYRELAANEQGVFFLGRLANYKYFDMDDAIKEAFNLFETIK